MMIQKVGAIELEVELTMKDSGIGLSLSVFSYSPDLFDRLYITPIPCPNPPLLGTSFLAVLPKSCSKSGDFRKSVRFWSIFGTAFWQNC